MKPLDDELPLNDRLAEDRTMMAVERTLLAYIRTAVALVVAGASAVKLFAESRPFVVIGWSFIAASAALTAFGAWRSLAIRRRVREEADGASKGR
jgi:putative membrane protein